MKRKHLLKTLALLVLQASLAVCAQAQRATGARPPAERTDAAAGLSEAARRLVEESRREILGTGISAPYFAAHFRLARVVDKPGDRRVEWRVTVGEYETTLTDSVGDTTIEGRRVNLHSIASTLGTTADIRQTIPKARARKLLRDCIGRYTGEAVVFQPLLARQRAALFLTAQGVGPSTGGERAREREREREARPGKRGAADRPGGADRTAKADATADRPSPEREEEDDDRPPLFIGFVNLETGKCTRGEAVVR